MVCHELQNTIINGWLNQSHPSDHICITWEERKYLVHLWNNGHGRISHIPSDLFFSNTIPLKDFILTQGTETIRFVAFNHNIDDLQTDDSKPVGAVVFEDGCILTVFVSKGYSRITRIALGWDTKTSLKRDDITEILTRVSEDAIVQLYQIEWSIWYGIQIALLHPTLKEVFKTPQRTPYEGGTSPNKHHKKRRIKYIRKHYITLDKLEKALGTQNEGRKINRKCLAWYVIGHWRTYKSGKKVFVQGFWKGVLRDTKRNADGDDRERIIDTTERVGAS